GRASCTPGRLRLISERSTGRPRWRAKAASVAGQGSSRTGTWSTRALGNGGWAARCAVTSIVWRPGRTRPAPAYWPRPNGGARAFGGAFSEPPEPDARSLAVRLQTNDF